MAVGTVLVLCSSLLLLLLLVFPFGSNSQALKACKFDAIFQFGDSLADTGNLIRENPAIPFSRLPYGETFFKKATGRCSNGLLMVDYFAKAAGLPLVNPYLNKKASFTHGVNFVVAGSTALPLRGRLVSRFGWFVKPGFIKSGVVKSGFVKSVFGW